MPKNFAKDYLTELKQGIDNLPLDKVDEIAALLKKAYQAGKHIFVMGNGGSAATASHFVCDFAKGSGVKGKKKFKVIGLTDNVPLLTAWANDVSYEDVFSSQLEPLLEKDDLVIAFTGSGNSPNILKAIKYANEVGALTIAFTGFEGGKVSKIAQSTLIVPQHNMERIEDLHLIVEHLLHLYFLREIKEGRV